MHKVLKQIFQEEGYKGLFRGKYLNNIFSSSLLSHIKLLILILILFKLGGTLRISKVAASCAIMISTYEALKMT